MWMKWDLKKIYLSVFEIQEAFHFENLYRGLDLRVSVRTQLLVYIHIFKRQLSVNLYMHIFAYTHLIQIHIEYEYGIFISTYIIMKQIRGKFFLY